MSEGKAAKAAKDAIVRDGVLGVLAFGNLVLGEVNTGTVVVFGKKPPPLTR